jgi:hypothetical protein
MKVSQILDQIDTGDIALPEFQRGYVWNRDQVRGLFLSLYRGYPVGGFMTWNTKAEGASARGGPVTVDGTVKLLLDGQQRATTLYGVIRGVPPKFFEGNATAFAGLHFHLEDEAFEFYAPTKMKDNPAWINVTGLMAGGLGSVLPSLQTLSENDNARLTMYVNRVSQILLIKDRDLHIDEVSGPDKTVDVVVDIFNRVNSGGTKLSKGDLALAKIGASWPQARQSMNIELERWGAAGFDFRLDWLLRGVNAVVTGEALFSALSDVPISRIEGGLTEVVRYIDGWLNVISARLGLDHDRVMFGKFAVLVLARYNHQNGGKPPSAEERDRLLAWLVHAGMWGRYAGSTETVLNQDLKAIDSDGVAGLMDNLRAMRGDLAVRPDDFSGNSLGARFYPVLYLLTRTQGAQDWGDGTPLSAHLLGKLSGLQVHHIFPKARLYAAGYSRGEVNAVANFCFLTQGTNLDISDRLPRDYMPEIEARHPGALASQWVPTDPGLWEIDRYRDFLAQRRELLASATNTFLDQLWNGGSPLSRTDASGAWDTPPTLVVAPSFAPEVDERAAQIEALIAFLTAQGYAAPDVDIEVSDPESGRVLAVAEAFWPNGLQAGIGAPVVLDLDVDTLDEPGLQRLGYSVFTSCDSLRDYVVRAANVSADSEVAHSVS